MAENENAQRAIPLSTALGSLTQKNNSSLIPKHKQRLLLMSALALLIAVLVSCVARFLVYLIDFFTNLAFFGQISIHHQSPADNQLGLWVVVIPVVGGVVVGLMAFYGSKAIRGHGIPEAMEQILTNQSKIHPSIAYLKPLSSAISIGTGGPFGAEGPIIATGGALGSAIGQLLKITHHERKILLAAGATAGMSAIFGTPVAAIFLAIELLLFEFSPRSIIPVAIACITGAAGHHFLFENGPVFPAPAIEMPGNAALALYSAMGFTIGIMAALVTKVVYAIEDGFEKLPVHWALWPAIGGVAVGVIGYFAPHTLGVGYDNITHLLSGSLSLKVVLFLCVLKFISWAIALGSGTSGGTLAPLLTIGGATGVLLGMAVLAVFPNSGVALPLAAMVGMSAMFAGASRALLTSIVFALEATGQSNALLPLLGACTASYIISYFMMENTIMTEKIARRGVKAPHSYQADVLDSVFVKDSMPDEPVTISIENSITEVKGWLNKQKNTVAGSLVVVNNEGELQGLVRVVDVYSAANDLSGSIKTLLNGAEHSVSGEISLREAVAWMAKHNVDVIPVTLNGQGKVLTGVLTYKDVMTAYQLNLNDYDVYARHISLKRNGIKILLHGRKLLSRFSAST